MSSPLTLWYVARTQQEQDIRRAATWRRAHHPKAAAPDTDGGRAPRRPAFRRLASFVATKPGTGAPGLRKQKPRVSILVGTVLAVLLLGGQVVNGGAAAAIPLPPGGRGLPVTRLPHVSPAQLKTGAPLWPWLITAVVGIAFITWLVVENIARSRLQAPSRRLQKPLLHDAHRPSATH